MAQSRPTLGSVLRTPLGLTATVLTVGVLVLAVVAPILWTDEADAVDTGNILAGPSAEHWAGTDNLGRDIFYRVLVATRLSVELALLATAIAVVVGLVLGTAPFLLGRRAGRLVTASVNIAVAFPGLLLALFFAVIFGVGAKGAVLAIGLAGAPAVRPADPDPRRRRRGTRLRRGRAHDRRRSGPDPAAPRAAQHRRAAGRQRDDRRRRRAARVRRALLPRPRRPVARATTGVGCSTTASARSTSTRPPRWRPALAVLVAGLAFNLFGESVAKGLGIGTDRRRPAAARRAPAATTAPTTAAADAPHDSSDVVLDVRDLEVTFPGAHGPIRPVRGVTFAVRRGEAVGVVGESGSGKSLTALAVSRLVDDPGRVDATRLELLGTDLRARDSKAHRRLLGTSLAMVFQDPMTSFNPTRRIGGQLAEVARHHQGLGRKAALARAVDRLRAVRITDAERRAHQYPHEFSGGMRQRAMIGMGLMGTPALIVADEPTTALDVTVQRAGARPARVDPRDRRRRARADQPRRHRGPRGLRPGARDVRRPDRRGPARRRAGHGSRHPYTRALVAAVPDMDTDLDQPLAVIPGRPVDPADVPAGLRVRRPLSRSPPRAAGPRTRRS